MNFTSQDIGRCCDLEIDRLFDHSLSDMNESNLTWNLLYKNCTQSVPRANFVNIVAYCYVLPAICAIGLLGDAANLITLFSRRLKAVSYIYLRGLGLADLLCMIFVLVFVSFEVLTAMAFHDFLALYWVAWYRAHMMLPLINWSVSAGILIIVALTLERYICVSWPMLFRAWNSPRRAVGIVIAAYIIGLILYIPMCWQSVVVPKILPNNRCFMNITHLQQSERIYNQRHFQRWTFTDNKMLSDSSTYKAYKLTRETLVKFLPITALSILNLRIICVFKKVRRRRRRLNSSSGQTREQRSLLILLAGIVILFFICNIPAAINLLIISDAIRGKSSYLTFRAVANLLEITNHALNFYIFCLCSSDYRMTFLRKFPCVKAVQESADIIKRRLSNSFMRVHGSRKTSFRRSMILENYQIATSSLRSQSQQNRKVHFLRRAISSDALLRFDHSTLRPYRKFRGPVSSATTNWNVENSTQGNSNMAYEPVRKKKDRKYYASAESFQIFDTIPEDTSNHQLATHSAASPNEFTTEHKSSLGKRPTVSNIECGQVHCFGDYNILVTDTSCSGGSPFTPGLGREDAGKEAADICVVCEYDSGSDTLL